jgi:hypothetical protein
MSALEISQPRRVLTIFPEEDGVRATRPKEES